MSSSSFFTRAHHPEVVSQDEMPKSVQLRISHETAHGPARPLSLEDVDGTGTLPAPCGHNGPGVGQEPRRRDLLELGQDALRHHVDGRGAQELLLAQRVPGGVVRRQDPPEAAALRETADASDLARRPRLLHDAEPPR